MSESLTALDATFLELEEADQSAHMHIGGVMVFEPQPGGGAPPLDRVSELLAERLLELPRYSQRLSEPRTGGLRWPCWEEDPRFDIGKHLRRARLPGDGDDDDLRAWAGEFFSERLDRSRPLWEVVLLEGLEGGRWALVTKSHHCMVDGVGSVDVGNLLLDAEPEPERHGPGRPPPAPAAGPGPGAGGGWLSPRTLLGLPARAVRLGGRVVATGAGTVRHPDRALDALERARAIGAVLVRDELMAAPHSSINVPIGAKRRLATGSASLEELKAIKRALGGTVNDVVLAATAGGLRRLLVERGEEPPAAGLRAMVPVNIRASGEQLALGNRITTLFVHLPVAEPDPVRRYALQVDEAESLKSGDQALGSTTMIDLTGLAPPVLHTFVARSLYATRLFNLTITNVPGPQSPLYAFGSRMLAVWPLVPLAAEHSLALAVFSYDGTLFFTWNADMDSMPDLDVVARGAEEELATLAAHAHTHAKVGGTVA